MSHRKQTLAWQPQRHDMERGANGGHVVVQFKPHAYFILHILFCWVPHVHLPFLPYLVIVSLSLAHMHASSLTIITPRFVRAFGTSCILIISPISYKQPVCKLKLFISSLHVAHNIPLLARSALLVRSVSTSSCTSLHGFRLFALR
ncbi:hypothetical protein F4680DRAFT_283905 [Xylaria scruposa]|nr:hypothetical protein F4680DRAFT_283905 [Xylaria scruposa]